MHARSISLKEAKAFQGCVLAYGHFSTIHPGHIRYLRHACNLGQQLLVALIGDGGSISYPFNQQERAEALKLLGIADAVLLLQANELMRPSLPSNQRYWCWAMSSSMTQRFRPPSAAAAARRFRAVPCR